MITNSVQFFETESIKPLGDESELVLAAWEIKNPGNMGHIIRLGHNLNAVNVLFINHNSIHRESKIRKTAGFSFDQQAWQIITPEAFNSLLNQKYKLAVLETCSGASNIFKTRLPGKLIILAGNETHGLPAEIIEKSDYKLFVPMPGNCKSMNVSHALSVGAFEWFRQHQM